MARKSELSIGIGVTVEHEAPDLPHVASDGEGDSAFDLYGPRHKPGEGKMLGALEFVAVPSVPAVREALKARNVGHANELGEAGLVPR